MKHKQKDQIFIKWDPSRKIPILCYQDIISDDKGLRLLFTSNDNKRELLEIKFYDELVLRAVKEGRLQKTTELLKNIQPSTIYKVENSKLIEWFLEESYPLHDSEKLYHFFIDSLDITFDVITTDPKPKIKWISM